MKKIALLLLFIPIIGFSQLIKNQNLLKAVPANGENYKDYDVWLNKLNLYYTKEFEKTPVGMKHLIEELNELLKLNSLDFNKPDSDKSLYASYSKNIYDYGIMNTAILASDSEIDMAWLVIPKGIIKIELNKKQYLIMVR